MEFSDDDIKAKEAEADTLLSRPAATMLGEDTVTEKDRVVKEEIGNYPWPLLVRTVLLLNAFLALGINDAMGGPTLLDLRYDTQFFSLFVYLLKTIFSETWLEQPLHRSPSHLPFAPLVLSSDVSLPALSWIGFQATAIFSLHPPSSCLVSPMDLCPTAPPSC